MKHEINRACPITDLFSDRVLGFVKAKHVWLGNGTYRNGCAAILGVNDDDEFPIVEGFPGYAYSGWLPPTDFLRKVYEDAIDHSKTLTEGIAYRSDLIDYAGSFLRSASRSCGGFNRPLKLLDFGCGYGFLLRAFGSRDVEVFGYEPSLERRNIATRFTDHIYSDLESVSKFGPFDLIVCTEVLEHVPNPVETLTIIRGLARPGTLLAVTVPNCDSDYIRTSLNDCLITDSIPKAINPWEHLSYFSANSLRRVLRENGFFVVSDVGMTKASIEACRCFGDSKHGGRLLRDIFRLSRAFIRCRHSTELICRAD